VPPAHRELAEELSQQHQGACGLDFPGGPGACLPEANGNGNGSGHGTPLQVLQVKRAREREERRAAKKART
jgi:hypothetical protein